MRRVPKASTYASWLSRHKTLTTALIVVALAAIVGVPAAAQRMLPVTSESKPAVGYVLSDDGWANLRSCPIIDPRTGPDAMCPTIEKVDNHVRLDVWCWTQNETLPVDVGNYPLARWFFTTTSQGRSGYVHSSLVHLLQDVRQCSGDYMDARSPNPRTLPGVSTPPLMSNSYIRLDDGGPTGSGENWYKVQLSNFVSLTDVTVTCYVEDYIVGSFVVRTDADGSAFSSTGCKANHLRGFSHSVRVGEYISDHVSFTLPEADQVVELSRGDPAEAGYYYDIRLKNFPANTEVTVTCHDTVSPEGFRSFVVFTDGHGYAGADDKCRSGDGPEHWVTALGVESNRVRWTASPPTVEPTPSTQPQPSGESGEPTPPPASPRPNPVPPQESPVPPAPQDPPAPKPVATNLTVVIYGGGHVGVSFSVGWQEGYDPVICHFFIDGVEVFTAQCGTHSSKQFYGVSPGLHHFHATVSDRFGTHSEPTAAISRTVT